MINGKEVVAIIPARGGSKSVPGKNIKKLGDYPLIAYSVAAGLQSKFIDRTIVTTDDEAIAAVAAQYGAEIPFMRPKSLAGDYVTDFPVYEHALMWLKENENYTPDIVVQLRPTSPFRSAELIDDSIRELERDEATDCIRAVTPSGENPYKMWSIKEGVMQPILTSTFEEPYNMPRQKLPSTFWQTGHVEVIRSGTILEKKSLTGDVIRPIIVANKFAIDLDNLDQWLFAEYIMNKNSFNIVKPKG